MAEPESVARTVLAGRYHIDAELGRGGMATVYLAVDTKHGRRVALKVFRSDLAAAVGVERFLREIQITAGLNHPHILPLLDSGDADGLLFYVMPYVAGGSLRRLLTGEERIPVESVLRIGREVASALDHAHAQGVVHRDIKPENILFNAGLAVVADFGVARVVSLVPHDHVTRTGVAVGTLGYMSPEQAIGSAEVDARTDIFSLGCVVYEMLIGGTPAGWPVPDDVRLGRLSDVPSAHRARLDELPGRVEQVLSRALALKPQDRFPTAGGMMEVLVAASEHTPALTEERIKRLLDRAAELQALEPQDPGSLTVGAVEQVAAQVGIPPEHVRQAARELALPDATRVAPTGAAHTPARVPGGRAVGRPGASIHEGKWDHLVFSRVVGGETAESAFPAMVEEIEAALGIEGHASVLGGSFTWSPATQSEDARRLVISVRVKNGTTDVNVHEEFAVGGVRRLFVAGGVLAGGLTGLGIGALVAAPPVGALVGVALGVPAAIQAVIRLEKRMRRAQLEGLAVRLEQMVEDAPRKK